ncbi:hypothetical protein B1M_02000 [Burkholderia sp. TJI49]|nr:hypothetical protein B1M_02000 [Burkholderia sp. TJI49]
MLSAVQYIEHRHWQQARVRAAEILEQRDVPRLGSSSRASERRTQYGIGAQPALELRPVKFDQCAIDVLLSECVASSERRRYQRIDMMLRTEHPFPAIPLRISVTQLHRLILACRCAGRHGRFPDTAIAQCDANGECRITA